jgi:hypothetical protein
MTTRRLRAQISLLAGTAALLLTGCGPAQQQSPAMQRAETEQESAEARAQEVAEAALGMQAEVLAHGDLAQNGSEQIFAVNRLRNSPLAASGSVSHAPMTIIRAAIFEKEGDKWAELLRCDERLKNPYGYLAGSPDGRVSGWRLQFDPDTKQGLEMKFTPIDFEHGQQEPENGNLSGQTLLVRWNTKVKRYQSLDKSHERYLGEIPTLETPQSTLR